MTIDPQACPHPPSARYARPVRDNERPLARADEMRAQYQLECKACGAQLGQFWRCPDELLGPVTKNQSGNEVPNASPEQIERPEPDAS